MRSTWTTLAVVLALTGALLGVGAASGAPTATACEKHKDDCRGGGTGQPPATTLTIQGTVLFAGDLRTFQAQLTDGQASGQVAIAGQAADPVVEIVPPAGARDYYCVRVDPAADPPTPRPSPTSSATSATESPPSTRSVGASLPQPRPAATPRLAASRPSSPATSP